MNAGTKTARSAPLVLVEAEQARSANADFTASFQDLYSLGMDRVIGIEKASFATAVNLQSYAIDIYKNAFSFTPTLASLFETAAQAFATCMELQLSLLSMSVPHVIQRFDTWSATASQSGSRAHSEAERLESSMDIALGVCAL